ncbi:MAG: hypothetical protein J6L90_04685 [Clostridia bacterium]|nr:hypothetical protein [Clostridia bacterium]
MTSLERAEIRRLPKKYRPITAWGYFWYTVLFAIPLIGLICLIAFSFSDKSIPRRSYCRSIWLSLLIGIIFAVIVVAVVFLLMTLGIITPEMFDAVKEAIKNATVA